MARPAASSDSVLMGHRMERQLEKALLFRGVFLKELLERTSNDETWRQMKQKYFFSEDNRLPSEW